MSRRPIPDNCSAYLSYTVCDIYQPLPASPVSYLPRRTALTPFNEEFAIALVALDVE